MSPACEGATEENRQREFRNTHFSYSMGEDGIERFVPTPELQSDDTIGADPLPPGQVWAISPGGLDDHAGLYRIEVNVGPGSGVRLSTSRRLARSERASGMRKGTSSLAVGIWLATGILEHMTSRSSSALSTHREAGHCLVCQLCWRYAGRCSARASKEDSQQLGGLNLGGALDPVPNAVNVAELAVEKGATELLIPISARKQLNELSDDMATTLSILYYADAREALLKALGD